ncbi:MAG: hypothetical protein EA378_01145 [Phycisphaerales bacterium]|nr:MAG: hypothetical protein EA378_01145 [Phycisphaerales bacterium]
MLASVAGGLPGCARAPVPPELSVLSRDDAPASEALSPESVYLTQREGGTLYIDERGDRFRRRVERTGDAWDVRLEREHDEGSPEPVRTVELVRTPKGEIAMRALIDHAGVGPGRSRRGSRVVFEPPLVLLPASLGSEDAFESQAGARLFMRGGSEDDSSGEAGEARRSARLGASERLKLRTAEAAHKDHSRGHIEARVVEAELDLRFGRTRIRRTERLWVHPDLGIVAEAAGVRVSFAGIQVDRREHLHVMASEATPTPP